MLAEREIAHNRAAHDRVGAGYDANHPEIFNEVEQERLRAALSRAVSLVHGGGSPARALDVGAGTGNLTAHLLALGARVTAADLSPTLVAELMVRHGKSGRVEAALLNGRDLRPLTDASFDVVATYSVLHHVPDYAALVREMARVTRPGGVVFIDHERSDASWTSEARSAFLREAVVWPERQWWYFLQPSRYWRRVAPYLAWRRWTNPRWLPEGDLHVWPDDHIEWTRVESALRDGGCTVVHREEYLLYEPRYRREAWDSWRTRATDTQLMIARKG